MNSVPFLCCCYWDGALTDGKETIPSPLTDLVSQKIKTTIIVAKFYTRVIMLTERVIKFFAYLFYKEMLLFVKGIESCTNKKL